jgi:hypothetical protein
MQVAYLRACAKSNQTPDALLLKDLSNENDQGHVNITLDLLDGHELEALRTFIKLAGADNGLTSIGLTCGLKHKTRSQRGKLARLGLVESAITQRSEIAKLCKEVGGVLHRNQLQQLVLAGVILPPESARHLARGIGGSHLTFLGILKAKLTDPVLEILAPALGKARKLQALDLTMNSLTSACAPCLIRVLQAHCDHRNSLAWHLTLRSQSNRLPKKRAAGIRSQGLLLVSLKANSLDDRFMQELCAYLIEDKWLAGVQLQLNSINLGGVRLAEEMLQTNSSLCEVHLQNDSTSAQYVLQPLPEAGERYAKWWGQSCAVTTAAPPAAPTSPVKQCKGGKSKKRDCLTQEQMLAMRGVFWKVLEQRGIDKATESLARSGKQVLSSSQDASMLALCKSWTNNLRSGMETGNTTPTAGAGWDSRRVSISRLNGELRITNRFQQAIAKGEGRGEDRQGGRNGKANRDDWEAEFHLFVSGMRERGKTTVAWRELVGFFAPSKAAVLLAAGTAGTGKAAAGALPVHSTW